MASTRLQKEHKSTVSDIDQLPNPVQYICLAYLEELTEDRVKYPYSVQPKYEHGTFFDRNLSQRLRQAANDLLRTGNLTKALALITENPRLIDKPTEGRDRFGRLVIGTLLQIAGMEGNFNINAHQSPYYIGDKKEEKQENQGAVEILGAAAGLTPKDISAQLFPVLFSESAKKESAERKNYFLTALKEFGSALLQKGNQLPKQTWTEIDELTEAQLFYAKEINEFRKKLMGNLSLQKITEGYILDLQIFSELGEWFHSGWIRPYFAANKGILNALFWTNGWGSLQYILPLCDAQVTLAGVSRVAYVGVIPAHSFNTPEEAAHYSSTSLLGVEYFLDCVTMKKGYPTKDMLWPYFPLEYCSPWEAYAQQKKASSEKYKMSEKVEVAAVRHLK